MKLTPIETILENYQKNPSWKKRLYLKEKISQGDLIKTGGSHLILIDDISIADNFIENNNPLFEKIYDHFSACRFHYAQNQDQITNLSDIIEKKIGNCLEKSIVTHLVLQKNKHLNKNILVGGAIGEDGNNFEPHAYNLIKSKKGWFVLDTSAPYLIKGKYVEYISKIKGIKTEEAGWPIAIEEKIQTNTTYQLSPISF